MVAVDEPALRRRLEVERVLELPWSPWASLLEALEVVERHTTGIAGDLVIARWDGTVLAIEHPTAEVVVVRRLADAGEGARLVAKRLAQYERMWDG